MKLEYWGSEFAVPVTGLLLLAAVSWDIIMSRPMHIGPIQQVFIVLTLAPFLAAVIVFIIAAKQIDNQMKWDKRIVSVMGKTGGITRGGRPNLEGIITTFALVHPNSAEWSLQSRKGVENLEVLRRYIEVKTGEEVSVLDIIMALKQIKKATSKRHKDVTTVRELFNGKQCPVCGFHAMKNHECTYCGAWQPYLS